MEVLALLYRSHHLSSKVISCVLTLALAVTTLAPHSVLAASTNVSSNKGPIKAIADTYRKKDPKPVKEVIEKRDRFSKHYLNDDGSYTAEISKNSVHYQDKDGKWQDISNRIVSATGSSKEAVLTIQMRPINL